MRYYIIGIGGVATGAVAGLLSQKGHEVGGSDGVLWEPMKSTLTKHHIPVSSPFDIANIKKFNPDMVVVGNAILRGNVELEYVLAQRLKYCSVVDVLRDEFIEGDLPQIPIVIAGTHGKTTTSALIAWILEYAGLDPTIFVGGILKHLDAGFKYGKGKYIVLEGDEYDTAFFDKNPKFLGYRPFIGVLNNIEFDHSDIFKDIDAVVYAFELFIKLIPASGFLAYGAGDVCIESILAEREKLFNGVSSKLYSVGLDTGDYRAEKIYAGEEKTTFTAVGKNSRLELSIPLHGTHNVKNILAALAVAQHLNIPVETIREALAKFPGVKRRAEILKETETVTLIDDYAHHPTAVRETISGMRLRFPNRRIVILFEPGSASSRKRIFEQQYVEALSSADVVFLYKPFRAEAINPNELFDIADVTEKLNKWRVQAWHHENIDEFITCLKGEIKAKDILVVMSCRGFDGLRERLVSEL